MQPHKQFITTYGKVMQNAITTSMIAEARKFKTRKRKCFRSDQKFKMHCPNRWGLHSLTGLPPNLDVNQSQCAKLVCPAFHRHNPPASPHGETFFVKPTELSTSFHVDAFQGWFF
jgi:hypothetical protein